MMVARALTALVPALVAACTSLLGAGLAVAQTTGSQVTGSQGTVTIVSPFAAGGTSDVIARATARGIEPVLKQTVIVENISGAGGTIGIANIARIKGGDGRRLVVAGTGSLVLAAGLHGKGLTYDARNDIVPVALVAEAPTVLVVSKSLPVKTLAELIAYLKREPDKVNFGSAGVGGSFHLCGVLFQKLAGVKINHVPYRGGAPLMTDLVGGHIQMAFADPTLVAEHVASGNVRVLAVAGPKRAKSLPDAPTSAEAGLPGLELVTWYGVMAPKGTPKDSLDRLSAAVLNAARSADFQTLLSKQALEPVAKGPDEFGQVIDADFKRWIPIITELGVKPE
jgi:tripartite-type tricarboxylate transporter receptor subunit TctC